MGGHGRGAAVLKRPRSWPALAAAVGRGGLARPAALARQPALGPPAAGSPDVVLVVAVMTLMAIGLVMVLSSSFTRAMSQFGNPYYFFVRQLAYALLGWVVAAACLRLDVGRLRQLAVPLVLGAHALLAAVLLLGEEIGGARRWIELPFVNLQPSELAKLACINFAAAWAAQRAEELHRPRGVAVPLAVSGVAFGLIMLEPDFGTGVVLMAVTVVVLFAAGMRLAHLVALGVLAVPAGLLLIWTEPYRLARLLAFVDPWADPTGRGWSVIQSLLALGSGGLVGLGLGQSRQKFFYLPEHHTDFIFAILGEELGLLGGWVVLVLFAVVAWRGFRIALALQNRYEQLLACGMASLLVCQAALNVGVVSGSLPVTGIPLPFLSYGGSSLVGSMVAVGLLLRLSREVTA